MSEDFAAPPPPPPGPVVGTRPATVTVATWLLLATAVLFAVSGVVMLATAGTVTEVYQDAYAGTELEGSETTTVAGIIVGGVLSILFGVGFVVLALLDFRAKNPARIVTWVLGGVALCCSGGGLALTALLGSLQIDSADGPDPAEVQRMVDEALPAWAGPVSLVATIGSILALALALLLLALPPSNEFFRKPAPTFEPPAPGYPPPPSPPPVG